MNVDYSKYLGKDYVYKFEGAGIHVINHSNMHDVQCFLASTGNGDSAIGDKRVFTAIPFFVPLMRYLDIVLFDRDSKSGSGERSNMIKLIKERADEAVRGERSALLVLAEGCTTYNTHVIRMK